LTLTTSAPTTRVPGSVAGKMAAVLAVFQDADGPLRNRQIAQRTGLPTSSVSRIVRELVATGLLERRGYDLWPGPVLFALGARTRRPHQLRHLALDTLTDLRRATGHTVHLAMLEARHVVYLEVLPGRTPTGRPFRPGDQWPAHATAVGKALLAHFPTPWQDTYLQDPLEPAGPRTLTCPRTLRNQLSVIRAHGAAHDLEEAAPGIGCIAAPVLGANGLPIAALGVSGPSGDVTVGRATPAVRAAAQHLSRHAHQHLPPAPA
jgi:IclR family acetate operon transcriptional repressor